MSDRRFRYRDQEWEVIWHGTGIGGGVSAGGYIPEVTRYSVTFRCLTGPTQGEIRGYLTESNLGRVSDSDLVQALERAIREQRGRGK